MRFNALDTAKTLVGYIWGGIESPRRNIFQGSESESFPSNKILKVYLKKTGTMTSVQHYTPLVDFNASPNPASTKVKLAFSLSQKANTYLYITDSNGRIVETLLPLQEKQGNVSLIWNARTYAAGMYFCNLQINGIMQTFPLMIQ